jgi:hypothetical protein
MSFLKKLFGSSQEASEELKDKEISPFNPEIKIPADELFTLNFRKNGGKFLYCDTLEDLKEQFLNILEENDWFECDVMCFDPKLFSLLDDNKLNYKNVSNNAKFILCSCENLIADEGSVLLTSNQIKHHKPHELPTNMVVFASTSQILENKGEGLRVIKKKYDKDYPTNITTIKYFEKHCSK